MDLVRHQRAQRFVDHPVACEYGVTAKALGNDADAVVTGPAAGTFVSGVVGAIVDDLEMERLERSHQHFLDEPAAFDGGHGLTLTKGCTSTLANTRSAT